MSRPHNRHRRSTRPTAGIWAHPHLLCSTVRYHDSRHRRTPPPVDSRTGRFPHRRRCSTHRPHNTDRGWRSRALLQSMCRSSRRRHNTPPVRLDNNRRHRRPYRPDSNNHPRTVSGARDNSAVSARALGDEQHRHRRSRLGQWWPAPQPPADRGATPGENHPLRATGSARRTGDHPCFTSPHSYETGSNLWYPVPALRGYPTEAGFFPDARALGDSGMMRRGARRSALG